MLFKLQTVATKAEGRTKSATPGRGLTTPLTTCWSASVSEMAKESGRANLWVGETFWYIYIFQNVVYGLCTAVLNKKQTAGFDFQELQIRTCTSLSHLRHAY